MWYVHTLIFSYLSTEEVLLDELCLLSVSTYHMLTRETRAWPALLHFKHSVFSEDGPLYQLLTKWAWQGIRKCIFPYNVPYKVKHVLHVLRQLPALETLSYQCYAETDFISYLSLYTPSLKELDLSHNWRLNVSPLQCLKRLETLNVAHCTLEGTLQNLPQLKQLNLACTTFTAAPLFAETLSHMQELEELNISYLWHMIDVSFIHQLRSLKRLKILKSPVQDFSFLQSLPLLESFDVSYGFMADLSCLLHSHRLKALKLTGCEAIEDHDLSCLSTLPELEAVYIGYCKKITNIGLQSLRPLQKLRILNLNSCEAISDEGFQGTKHWPLEFLCVRYCFRLSNAFLGFISVSCLRTLILVGCVRLTEEGLGILATAPLSTLNVYKCPLIPERFHRYQNNQNYRTHAFGTHKTDRTHETDNLNEEY